MSVETKRFNARALVSLNMMISFVLLIISSVVVYIMPPGRDAYWTNWKFWSLDKDQWGALHTVGGLAFLVFALIHLIFFNWKPFWNYVVSRIRKTLNRKTELAVSAFVNILIVLVCVLDWFPSSTIMNWGTSIKESWVKTDRRAPFGHAELETLSGLSKKLGLNPDAVVEKLKAKGISADAEKTVKYIASQNGLSPADLFAIFLPPRAKDSQSNALLTEGAGWGRKTVKTVCEEFRVNLEEALARLGAQGIEARPDSSLRELSGRSGLSPVEVAGIIQGKSR